MTRLIQFTPGEYFHLYNRGTNKMEIFNRNYDYERFQKLLYLVNSKQTLKYSDIETNRSGPCRTWTLDRGETLVDIGAYCLMPNHFHLLIKSKNEKDTSTFIQRLLTSHSKYFNTKNDRTGSLFQGKSKTKHILGNNYLKYMFSYIHLNPVKLIQKDWKEKGLLNIDKTKDFLKEYKYSSYLDYLTENKREEYNIINKSVFPDYFSSPELFNKEIFDWLQNNNE
jgi:putative transposase